MPDGTSDLPITVVMNAGSGSDDKRAARDAMEATLKACGRDVETLLAHRPRDLPDLARQAAGRRPGILAAAGGDGTLNAVAAVALERGLPFAVIPLGTFNYFARDLGIPLDTAAAARVIAEGTVRRVAVGRVNGRIFLNNASIGLYRRLIEYREVHKRRFGRNRMVAVLSALAVAFGGQRPYRLRMEIDGRPLELASLSVFFGRNVLQMEQFGLDEAFCVARGELAVLALRAVGPLELMRLVLRGVAGNLEPATELAQYCARTVEVDWLQHRSRKIRVAMDGEVAECTLPLLIEAVPDALAVIVPRQPAERR